ncbi:hypothetical protein BD410DRAFT_579717 [Rickenella mellea]|uniref:Uncharacterized protein n=1 Tax=Rickenella mellea TaxID=50990 RepID=A0A4Y7PQA2_9AGAM|nr:hypothetical protein BD410DRAFT_579717 [Rickenella mellea]
MKRVLMSLRKATGMQVTGKQVERSVSVNNPETQTTTDTGQGPDRLGARKDEPTVELAIKWVITGKVDMTMDDGKAAYSGCEPHLVLTVFAGFDGDKRTQFSNNELSVSFSVWRHDGSRTIKCVVPSRTSSR